MARRFDLAVVAIALPRDDDWDVFAAGALAGARPPANSPRRSPPPRPRSSSTPARVPTPVTGRWTSDGQHRAAGAAAGRHPADRPAGRRRAAGGTRHPRRAGRRRGHRHRAGAACSRSARPASSPARARQLKTALLASLGHDLRTPLTAIRVAAANLQARGAVAPTSARNRPSSSRPKWIASTGCSRTSSRWPGSTPAVWPASRARPTRRRSSPAAREQVGQALRGHHVERRTSSRDDADARRSAADRVGAGPPAGERRAVRARRHRHRRRRQRRRPTGWQSRCAITVPGWPRPTCRTSSSASTAGRGRERTPSGTGMGLWIARGLLEVQGGRVWAENAPGRRRPMSRIAVPGVDGSADAGEAPDVTGDTAHPARRRRARRSSAPSRRCCAVAATRWRWRAPAPMRCVCAAEHSPAPRRARPRPARHRGHRGLPAHPRHLGRADHRAVGARPERPTRCRRSTSAPTTT